MSGILKVGGKVLAEYNSTNDLLDVKNAVVINDTVISENVTIPTDKSAFMAGPVTLNNLTINGNLSVTEELNTLVDLNVVGILNLVG